ncbi:MAG: hypothetical protein K2N32_04400, partial [Clostridia bacterium]|nr:hypothetical protein [Clostridia bacterium]
MNLIPLPKRIDEKGEKISIGKNTIIEGDFHQSCELLKEYLSKFNGGENTKVIFVKDENIANEG